VSEQLEVAAPAEDVLHASVCPEGELSVADINQSPAEGDGTQSVGCPVPLDQVEESIRPQNRSRSRCSAPRFVVNKDDSSPRETRYTAGSTIPLLDLRPSRHDRHPGESARHD
jgi:hypothetical protein